MMIAAQEVNIYWIFPQDPVISASRTFVLESSDGTGWSGEIWEFCVCNLSCIFRQPLEGSESTLCRREYHHKCMHVSPVNNQQGVKERSRIMA